MSITDLSDDALIGWLEGEGFDHVVEHAGGEDLPPSDEYWILEAVSADHRSYLVNQDTAVPGRWRVSKGSNGQGEWEDVGTDLTASEAQQLLIQRER